MNEFEIKFEVPDASLAKLLAAVRAKKAQLQLLQACYFDTRDQMLAKHGVVIRLRRENDVWVQTVKASTSNALERLEHNLTIENTSNVNDFVMPDINLSQKLPKDIKQLLELILKINLNAQAPALIPVYETDVQRLKFNVMHSGSLIEIALDQGMVESNGKSAALCELEFELKEGKPEHVVAVARKWRALYGLHVSTISKSMKGQRLWGDLGVNVIEAKVNVAANQKPAQHANALVKSVFSSCINQMLANASELAINADIKPDKSLAEIQKETDCIHQLRVAIRRLRVALREFKSLVDTINPAWEKPLIDIFRELGKRRDADHLMHELQPAMIKNGSPAFKLQASAGKAVNVSAVVLSEKFQDTLLCLIGFVNSQPLIAQTGKANKGEASIGDAKINKLLKKRLNHWYKKSIEQGENFVKLTQTQQHDVRKVFKKLRYLSEFSVSYFVDSDKKNSRAESFSASLKPVQDALGSYNDELVALETFKNLAKNEPKALYSVGWLSARREINAKKCQQAIDVFIDKTRCKKLFWQMN